MALEREIETYKKHHQELLPDAGKFILIQGEVIVGKFASYSEAVTEGYERFGTTPFLVKKIEIVEQIQYIQRVAHCHPSP